MCGIGGILFSSDTQEVLTRKMQIMNDMQKHRGPDGCRMFVSRQHAVCFQRLALIDADGGHQPFRDPTGRYILVFNGELYNYLELKEELKDAYPFCTHSDTEVVLASYIVYKERCVERFNGMFAFMVLDTKLQCGFAARDPMGVKPFVYHYKEGAFTFASEMKALLKVLSHRPVINPYMLAEYLIAPYLSGVGDASIFEGIRYLEPGQTLSISESGLTIRKYYSFNWKENSLAEDELVQMTEEAMEKSVRFSLRADVPVGVFLSGGLDSSLITAIAAKYSESKPSAYSITFEDHEAIEFDASTIVNGDDLPYAQELARLLGLPFQRVVADHETLSHSLQNIARINDRIPVWEQEFSQHFLSKAAHKEYRAVLVGDASDETNYGYYFLLNEETNHSPLGLLTLFGGQKRTRYLAEHLQDRLKPLEYLDSAYRTLAHEAGYDFAKGGEESILAMSTLIHRRWLTRLLHNGDVHTMHFGLEARVPFANRNLLDVVCMVLPRYGYKDGVEKQVLRQVSSKWLPPHFYKRKKSALPRDPRLGKAYQAILSDLLAQKNEAIDAYLSRSALNELSQQDVVSENDRMTLFNVISLINWMEVYAK